jgi:ABC-type lipoprotein release transport system permease subunit
MLFIQLAWRNLWRNKMRSFTILVSVSLGLFAGIAVLSLYQGMMDGRVKTVIEDEIGHIQIHHPSFHSDNELKWTINSSSAIKNYLFRIPSIKSISSRSIAFGMLSTTTGSGGVQINGIIPSEEEKTTGLNEKIISGDYFDKTKKRQILIGKKLADKLKLHKGSKLVLTTNDTSNNLVAGAFKIAGIYESVNAPLDEKMIYIEQSEFNEMMSLTDGVHQISILLHNNDSTEFFVKKLKDIYPHLLVQSWKELSPETDLLIKTIDRYSLIILIIIFVALAFGIINTMLMAILERTKEIGMMIALGTGRFRMFGIVMTETFFLTMAGTPPGIIVSRIIVNYFHKEGLNLSNMGTELMSSFGFKTIIYPVFPSEQITTIILIVSCTALISGILPAWRALKMTPSEALRN